MKNEPVTKRDLHEALEEQSKTIIDAIDTSTTDIRNDILDRINRLENTYALETRMKRVEEKLGIKPA